MFNVDFKKNDNLVQFMNSITNNIGFKGGTIAFKEADIDYEICVNTNFYDSHRIKDIKFTNYVRKNNCENFMKPIRNLLNDSFDTLKLNRQINFKSNVSKRINNILDYYIPDVPLKTRQESLYKIHPVENVLTGKTSETVRVYLTIENLPNVKTTYTLVLIDLYHLVIPAPDSKKRLSKKQTVEKNYKDYSRFNDHIKDAIDTDNFFC